MGEEVEQYGENCNHAVGNDGPCSICVEHAERAKNFRELWKPVRPNVLTYDVKLRAFEDRFKKHEWWKKRIEGTPLSNDLACMAVEVFNALTAPASTTHTKSDTIMEYQADVTALSYHLRRAVDVLSHETPLDVNQIAEAKRALENVADTLNLIEKESGDGQAES